MGNKQRNAFYADFKLHEIDLAVTEGNGAAERKLGINESMVWRWRRQSEELPQCKSFPKTINLD